MTIHSTFIFFQTMALLSTPVGIRTDITYRLTWFPLFSIFILRSERSPLNNVIHSLRFSREDAIFVNNIWHLMYVLTCYDNFQVTKTTFLFLTYLLTFVFTKVKIKTNFDNTWIFDELGEFHITFQSSLKRSNRHISIFTCHFE